MLKYGLKPVPFVRQVIIGGSLDYFSSPLPKFSRRENTGAGTGGLGCGALFRAGVGFGPGFAFVGGLEFFKADVIAVEEEVLCARPVAPGLAMRESGGRLVEIGPVVAVQREIAARSSLPIGHYKTGVEIPRRRAGGIDEQRLEKRGQRFTVYGLLAG